MTWRVLLKLGLVDGGALWMMEKLVALMRWVRGRLNRLQARIDCVGVGEQGSHLVASRPSDGWISKA